MAPEQAKGDATRLDRRSDVYSLGATLYDLLCGRPPFVGPTVVDVLTELQMKEPPPPRQISPTVPADLEAIVLKCLEKDPGLRYDSAKALAEELQRYLEGEP